MKSKLQNKASGFTIIEVLIVLAIAALILVVVLVAIPQLQRNQRNSARQNDMSRVITSVQNWSANNNGKAFPSSGTDLPAARLSVKNDLDNLAQYDLPDDATALAAIFTVNAAGFTGTPTDAANTPPITAFRVIPGHRCTGTDAEVTSTGVSTRGVAIQYSVETTAASGVERRCVSS
jgi:prepilin-type N-terminal cleavage/methylation domain-containing protein